MRPAPARVLAVAFVAVLAARPAAAQSTSNNKSNLSNVLIGLLTDGVTLAAPATQGAPDHEAHFLALDANNPNGTVSQATYPLAAQFNSILVGSLATFPLGSSSGGFVFEGDPALGDFKPASRSFGPTFGERALTSGKGNFNVGLNFQRASYSSFEGKNLDDGSLVFFLHHNDCCPPRGTYPLPSLESDLIQEKVSLDLDTNSTAFLFNYGLTDRWDVGAAVPIVHVSVTGSVDSTIQHIASGVDPNVHLIPNGTNHFAKTDSGTATGLGDIVVRSKYRFLKAPGGGLAAALDLRLPSGDEENLLGLGAAQAKFLFIASQELANVALHGNVSYAVAGTPDSGAEIPKEFGYNVGAEVMAGRATVTFDLIGRSLRNAVRFADRTENEPIDPTGNFVTRTAFLNYNGTLNQVLGVAGVKVLVAPHLLLTVNGMFSMNDAGLKAKFIPVLGFEYVFPRR
jgi:hypothetical protein